MSCWVSEVDQQVHECLKMQIAKSWKCAKKHPKIFLFSSSLLCVFQHKRAFPSHLALWGILHYIDQHFVNEALAVELQSRRMYLLGTLRKNRLRVGIPPGMVSKTKHQSQALDSMPDMNYLRQCQPRQQYCRALCDEIWSSICDWHCG